MSHREERLAKLVQSLPTQGEWTPDEGLRSLSFTNNTTTLDHWAYTPEKDHPNPAYVKGAQYGLFTTVYLDSKNVRVWAFSTAAQRDQFVADVGATPVPE